MLGSREETPRFQSDFYRYKYYKILRWVMYSLALMLLLLLAVLYLVLFQPAPKYYANTMTGRILPMPTPKR